MVEQFFGWFFVSPDFACTFPGPLPAWLFQVSGLLTNVILYFLCGRFS